MKWALMGVALFELIVILVSVIIYFDYNSRRDLGTLEGVLFLMALLTIVNLLVPILRNKNLDTKDKRKMSLLIFGGLGLQFLSLFLSGDEPDRFIRDVYYQGISDFKLFWLGSLIALVGIATSYWYNWSVIPFKKWVSADTN